MAALELHAEVWRLKSPAHSWARLPRVRSECKLHDSLRIRNHLSRCTHFLCGVVPSPFGCRFDDPSFSGSTRPWSSTTPFSAISSLACDPVMLWGELVVACGDATGMSVLSSFLRRIQ